MTLRRLAFPTLLALLALAAPAAAQTPTTPTPPPVPPPAAGAATLTVDGGVATKKTRYFAPFQYLIAKGRVKPYVAGQRVQLQVVRKGKVSKTVTRAVGAGGRYAFRVRLGNPGGLRLVVRHAATPEQAAFRAKDVRAEVVNWSADVGQKGVKVLLLQRQLEKLGFAVPVTGYYDDATARAVLAFRKTNRMGTTGYASSSVYSYAFRDKGAYKLRYPKAGKHVEFDWSRQVVVLANKGRPYRVYHTSSGAPATPTVFGTYRFYMKTAGTNAKGMVDSSYFIRGYAIHGYPSVPAYPASHGCLRVPIPNARAIYDWIDIGDQIFLYKT
jgi:L,D-transpeptidase-like protein/putative peptidoglycan binding protein